MSKYEMDVNVSLKNAFMGEGKLGHLLSSKYHFKTNKQNNLFKSFLSFSSDDQKSHILFQIAETVKFNENALLKMHHMQLSN